MGVSNRCRGSRSSLQSPHFMLAVSSQCFSMSTVEANNERESFERQPIEYNQAISEPLDTVTVPISIVYVSHDYFKYGTCKHCATPAPTKTSLSQTTLTRSSRCHVEDQRGFAVPGRGKGDSHRGTATAMLRPIQQRSSNITRTLHASTGKGREGCPCR